MKNVAVSYGLCKYPPGTLNVNLKNRYPLLDSQFLNTKSAQNIPRTLLGKLTLHLFTLKLVLRTEVCKENTNVKY